MSRTLRAAAAAALLAAAGCCDLCRCCDGRNDRLPPGVNEGPPPYQPPPGVLPPVGPSGTGAYGGTGP